MSGCRFVRALALFASFVFCCAANAYPVTWTLSGVTFDDGGTATGYFVYDADIDTLSTFSVSVAGGATTTFPPFTYDNASSSGSVYSFGAGDVGTVLDQNGTSRGIRIPAVSALTDAGGTLAVNIAGRGAAECYNCGPARVFTGGNLIGTAPPSITSPASATFAFATTLSFSVTTTGAPLPTLTVSGTLPPGVAFTDNGDGTGTFSGSSTTSGSFALTVTASNGAGPDATQSLSLKILPPFVPSPAPTLGWFGLLAAALLLLLAGWSGISARIRTRS